VKLSLLILALAIPVLVFVGLVYKELFRFLRERAKMKERARIRKEAHDRSKELLQFLLADPETAKLIRDNLVKELGTPDEEEEVLEERKPGYYTSSW
jgi:uncharacterized membrane protein YcjF (UPF0283 family)